MSEHTWAGAKILWIELLGELPSERTWEFWRRTSSVPLMAEAIHRTAKREIERGFPMSHFQKIQFCTSAMCRWRQDWERKRKRKAEWEREQVSK